MEKKVVGFMGVEVLSTGELNTESSLKSAGDNSHM